MIAPTDKPTPSMAARRVTTEVRNDVLVVFVPVLPHLFHNRAGVVVVLACLVSAATWVCQLPQDKAGSAEAANNGHNDFEIPNHCLLHLLERIPAICAS
ncbi:hypothetical protein DQ393_14240 [Rhizobium tropici]|uniref:Uncharacterized protein n=1 Tax=Rhizobium tropici TaxID=398 RepID=A0A329YKA6_RHITR|nr:hypothetical protein DQ393_14240 [Rhizobium tropici]